MHFEDYQKKTTHNYPKLLSVSVIFKTLLALKWASSSICVLVFAFCATHSCSRLCFSLLTLHNLSGPAETVCWCRHYTSVFSSLSAYLPRTVPFFLAPADAARSSVFRPLRDCETAPVATRGARTLIFLSRWQVFGVETMGKGIEYGITSAVRWALNMQQ